VCRQCSTLSELCTYASIQSITDLYSCVTINLSYEYNMKVFFVFVFCASENGNQWASCKHILHWIVFDMLMGFAPVCKVLE
jgi:hypothetical protein